jgi:hypothetical protein
MSCLDHNASTYWINNMSNWAAAHGLQDVFELCNTLVTIAPDGSQRLPLLANNPDHQVKSTLRRPLKECVLSRFWWQTPHLACTTRELQHVEEQQVRTIFTDSAQVASTLYFRLSNTATLMKYAVIPSVMPEVFAESDSTMKTNDVKKPLSGFVTLAQIVNIFNRNPQGTALQMKRKQIKMLENNPSFTLYKGHGVPARGGPQDGQHQHEGPGRQESLEKEVLQTVYGSLRQACRNTKDGKHSTALTNAAELSRPWRNAKRQNAALQLHGCACNANASTKPTRLSRRRTTLPRRRRKSQGMMLLQLSPRRPHAR